MSADGRGAAKPWTPPRGFESQSDDRGDDAPARRVRAEAPGNRVAETLDDCARRFEVSGLSFDRVSPSDVLHIHQQRSQSTSPVVSRSAVLPEDQPEVSRVIVAGQPFARLLERARALVPDELFGQRARADPKPSRPQTEIDDLVVDEKAIVEQTDPFQHAGGDHHAASFDDIHLFDDGRIGAAGREPRMLEESLVARRVEDEPIDHHRLGLVHVVDDGSDDAEVGVRRRRR